LNLIESNFERGRRRKRSPDPLFAKDVASKMRKGRDERKKTGRTGFKVLLTSK
jgi:hypothetical protein